MYVSLYSESQKVIKADAEEFASIVIDNVKTLPVCCCDDEYFSPGVEFYIIYDGDYVRAQSISLNKSNDDDNLFLLSFEIID